MQIIYFARSFGMLQVPHPLFAYDENFHRALGRPGFCKEEAGAPEKKTDTDEAGNYNPGHLETHGLLGCRRALFLGAPAIFDHEIENRREDEKCEKQGNTGQEEIQMIDTVSRRGRVHGAKLRPLSQKNCLDEAKAHGYLLSAPHV